MVTVAVGEVVLIFDGTTRPPKYKRLLCVSDDGWFLRINSKPLFRPHLEIYVADNLGCLDHDSFVELRGVLDLDLPSLGQDITSGAARLLGQIGSATVSNLKAAVAAAVTLTPTEKARIDQALAALP
jgi:hypothetical protein